MNNLGMITVPLWEESTLYSKGDWVEMDDGLHKLTDEGFVLVYAKDGPSDREVLINGRAYFKVDEFKGSAEKPPIVILSQQVHDEARKHDLAEIMIRYLESNKEIPLDWVDEYNEIISRWQK